MPEKTPANAKRDTDQQHFVAGWLKDHMPTGDEPISIVLDELLDMYKKTYGYDLARTSFVNNFGKFRRGEKPLPRKVEDLMRAERVDFEFGLDRGPAYVKKLCRYLGLPVPGDI